MDLSGDVRIGTYGDLWQKELYRVDLIAEVDRDFDDVDAALEKLGYRQADVNQWGRSYSHTRYPGRTAELDEVADHSPIIRLVLRHGELSEDRIDEAKEELLTEYWYACPASPLPRDQDAAEEQLTADQAYRGWAPPVDGPPEPALTQAGLYGKL